MDSGVLERQSASGRGGFQLDSLAGESSSVVGSRDILGAGAKRTIDVIGSLVGLLVLSPVFLLIALAIKLDSRGPVIFPQVRNGLKGERFLIYKFRSMTEPAVGGELAPGPHDERRITRVGRWLRASNLDELPQLWNVFTGSMSLVGPRPHPLPLDAALSAAAPRLRHAQRREAGDNRLGPGQRFSRHHQKRRGDAQSSRA